MNCPICGSLRARVGIVAGQACWLPPDSSIPGYIVLSVAAFAELTRKAEAWEASQARLLVDTRAKYDTEDTP